MGKGVELYRIDRQSPQGYSDHFCLIRSAAAASACIFFTRCALASLTTLYKGSFDVFPKTLECVEFAAAWFISGMLKNFLTPGCFITVACSSDHALLGTQ